MKRKIKNFKDFLSCIKAGKKVTEDNGHWSYVWEEGYIYCKCSDGGGLYNATVDDYNLENMEVEEQAPFTIEVGKFYKTRDGRKAYCFDFKKETGLEDAFFDFVIDNYGGFSTKINGKVFFTDNNDDVLDIVDYWE